MSTEKRHSERGASSAYRWMNCPGSVNACRGIPNESSPFAKEGQLAHAVGEEALNSGQDAAAFIDRPFSEFPDMEVDEEMCEAVQVYLDTIRADMAKYPDAELAVEKKFDLTHIYPGLFGTNDASIYIPSLARVIVYDYKHGRGIPVEVEENEQMLYYGVGATTGAFNRPLASIELVVVQPRCRHSKGPVRRWETDPVYLTDWIADLVAAAKATEPADAPLCAGAWCKENFCPAAATCPALRAKAFDAARADFASDGSVVLSPVETLTPETMADILDNADLVEHFIRSVRARAHLEAEAGRDIPGYMLAPKRATRKWKSEERLLEEMVDYGFSKESITNPGKLMSPAQTESFLKTKGFKKKEIDVMLDGLAHAVSSGSTLVRADSGRERLKAEASTEFMT
jgi:hypothetical protein